MTSDGNIKTWKNKKTRKLRITNSIITKLGMNKEQFIKIVDKLVKQGKSTKEISILLNVSTITINKYATDKNLLRNINKNKQYTSNFKDCQSSLYLKIRKEIKDKKHKCVKCNSFKNIEIHHKDKINYDDTYSYWKSNNFNNNKDNIIFLCNSCHQKTHYRELGRIHKVNHDPRNGRFLRGSFKGGE